MLLNVRCASAGVAIQAPTHAIVMILAVSRKLVRSVIGITDRLQARGEPPSRATSALHQCRPHRRAIRDRRDCALESAKRAHPRTRP